MLYYFLAFLFTSNLTIVQSSDFKHYMQGLFDTDHKWRTLDLQLEKQDKICGPRIHPIKLRNYVLRFADTYDEVFDSKWLPILSCRSQVVNLT